MYSSRKIACMIIYHISQRINMIIEILPTRSACIIIQSFLTISITSIFCLIRTLFWNTIGYYFFADALSIQYLVLYNSTMVHITTSKKIQFIHYGGKWYIIIPHSLHWCICFIDIQYFTDITNINYSKISLCKKNIFFYEKIKYLL